MASQVSDEAPLEATLLVHPERAGLLLLAWRGDAVAFAQVPGRRDGEEAAALSERLAGAAAPLLAGAERVHVQVHRSLAALPLDRSLARALGSGVAGGAERGAAAGAAGAAGAPPLVAFTVEAPARVAAPHSPARCDGPARALLVSDPQQNLWAASQSAPLVRAQLQRRGLVVDELRGAAVTRAALLARLADPCVQLLHYDGHARAAEGDAASSSPAGASPLAGAPPRRLAGRDRLDDALLLAGGATLTAAQILTLPRVPPAVVLNGCTTAAPEGLGLAQAFLAAGAHQVLASLDEIDAAAAARFTARLFEERASSGAALDLVSLFWHAISLEELPAMRAYER